MSRHEPYCVVVAEDDAITRHATVYALGREGYRILEAADGGAALRLIEGYAGPIHLLVTDMNMPGMNGDELARRARRRRPSLPVLVVSGIVDPDRYPEFRILTKPLDLKHLLHTVRELLATVSDVQPPIKPSAHAATSNPL